MNAVNCLVLLMYGDLANPSEGGKEAAKYFRRNAVQVMTTEGWKKANKEKPFSLVKIHEFLCNVKK
jgi:hypothetical protein